jgi:hypothetical protein
MHKLFTAVRVGLAVVTLVLAPAEVLAAMPSASRPDQQDSMSALRIRVRGGRIRIRRGRR